jgi:hypothetical protein
MLCCPGAAGGACCPPAGLAAQRPLPLPSPPSHLLQPASCPPTTWRALGVGAACRRCWGSMLSASFESGAGEGHDRGSPPLGTSPAVPWMGQCRGPLDPVPSAEEGGLQQLGRLQRVRELKVGSWAAVPCSWAGQYGYRRAAAARLGLQGCGSSGGQMCHTRAAGSTSGRPPIISPLPPCSWPRADLW